MPVTTRPTPAAAPDNRWLSIGAAAALLGVSTATLRRWADDGEVQTFTTPGGHRRIARSAVDALLPGGTADQPPLMDAATPERIQRAYRRSLHDVASTAPFLDGVPSGAREALRSHGRAITSSILGYLDAAGDDARERALAEGLIAAAAYGRITGGLGATMREAVAAFLHFRMPFIHEMAATVRRRGLDAAGAAAFLEGVTTAMDRLLDALLEGYESATARSGGPAGRPGSAR